MLGWEYPPHITGGLGTACQGLVHGLVAAGIEVVLVLPRVHGDEREPDAKLVDCSLLDHALSFAPGACRQVAIDSPLRPYEGPRAFAARRGSHSSEESPATTTLVGGYGAGLFQEVERYAGLVDQIARTESFDLVHAHDWMTFPAGANAARASGRPLVIHVHACEHDRNPLAQEPRIQAIEQAGIDAADRIVSVSRYTARTLARNYRLEQGRVRILHNAVHLAPPRAPLHARKIPEPIVMFLGRVTSQKGPDYFLEAAARVVRVQAHVKFVLCGSGDMLAPIVERCARMGLARHVHFTGFLNKHEVEHMFQLADLYVMPSVSEPFGITPLEALAQGVPVIVSRQSGVTEVVRSALQVDYWDVEGLANQILAVLSRPALAEHLRSSGYEELRTITWEDRGRALNSIYTEVCA